MNWNLFADLFEYAMVVATVALMALVVFGQ